MSAAVHEVAHENRPADPAWDGFVGGMRAGH
jgi:hypothetical protein